MKHKQTVIVGLLLCGANYIIYPSMTISVNVTWMYEWSINTMNTFGDCCSVYIYIYMKNVHISVVLLSLHLYNIKFQHAMSQPRDLKHLGKIRQGFVRNWHGSQNIAGTIIRDQCRNNVFYVRYETAAIYKALIASWSLWSPLCTKRW